jgi:hypothetical protein
VRTWLGTDATAARARRRRCEQALSEVEFPVPFTVQAFCHATSIASGKQLALHPMPVGWAPAGLCGLLAETRKANHVYFTQQSSVLAQATTIIHECGHVLMPDGGGYSQEIPSLDLPKLLEQPIVSLRGRVGFSSEVEATVELFASMVLTRGSRSAAKTGPRAGDPPSRLEDLFG